MKGGTGEEVFGGGGRRSHLSAAQNRSMHPLPDARRFLNCIFMLARISKLRKKDERRREGREENGTARREQFIIPAPGEEAPPRPLTSASRLNVVQALVRGIDDFFPLSLKKPSAPSSIIIRIGIRTNLHVDKEIKKRIPSFRILPFFLVSFFLIYHESIWNLIRGGGGGRRLDRGSREDLSFARLTRGQRLGGNSKHRRQKVLETRR